MPLRAPTPPASLPSYATACPSSGCLHTCVFVCAIACVCAWWQQQSYQQHQQADPLHNPTAAGFNSRILTMLSTLVDTCLDPSQLKIYFTGESALLPLLAPCSQLSCLLRRVATAKPHGAGRLPQDGCQPPTLPYERRSQPGRGFGCAVRIRLQGARQPCQAALGPGVRVHVCGAARRQPGLCSVLQEAPARHMAHHQ
jgi:hypothetical protein